MSHFGGVVCWGYLGFTLVALVNGTGQRMHLSVGSLECTKHFFRVVLWFVRTCTSSALCLLPLCTGKVLASIGKRLFKFYLKRAFSNFHAKGLLMSYASESVLSIDRLGSLALPPFR